MLLLFLWSCAGGANPATLVEELRILSLAMEPPEAQAGESVTVNALVPDPLVQGVETVAWTCLGFGGECFEQDVDRRVVGEGEAPAFQFSLLAPFEALGLLEEEEEVPVTVWALACEPGLCALIEEEEPSAEDLALPQETLTALPMQGVSLARRSLWLSKREPGDRRENPTLQLDDSIPEGVGVEEEVTLEFTVEGVADAGFGYATAGGFTDTETAVVDGGLTMTWVAPDVSGEVDIWVVVQSDDGGGVTWSGSILVQ